MEQSWKFVFRIEGENEVAIMTFKILIVEDEKEKAKGIAYLVEKYNPICTPIVLAYDGQAGYDLALSEKPDIIMTDIRMPIMDGLEMIRALLKKGMKAEFIVLSGYAEFKYAKKAMELGVKDFITKPVDELELSALLNKLCKEILERKSSEDSMNKMSDDVLHYVLRGFVLGEEDSNGKIREYFASKQLLDRDIQFFCIVFEEIPPDVLFDGEEGYTDGVFIQYIRIKHKHIAMIVAGKNLDMERKRDFIENINEKHKQTIKRGSAGVSDTYHNYYQIPEAYKEAKVALNYKILKGNNSVIFYEDIYNLESRTDLLKESEMEQIKDRIDRFDQRGFQLVVKAIFRRVLSENQISLPELRKLSLKIVLLGLHNVPVVQLQMNEYFGKNLFTLKSIEKFQTIEQLENWIFNMVGSMNELMLKESVPKKLDVIAEAKEYIKHHYNKNITLNDISKKFYINPYYFSQLFKKKTGITYQAYLTNYRIDIAKKLLKETDLRIYEVGRLVGYSDVNHFSQVFAKTEGVKPSKYRQEEKEEEVNE